jgi:outer membrane protein assembly factor BamC
MKRFFPLACAALLVSACGKTVEDLIPFEDRAIEYKKAKQVNTLEVPPDLTRSSIDETLAVPDIAPTSRASFSSYAAERGGSEGGPRQPTVLTPQGDIEVLREGDKRWLLVKAAPDLIWPKVRQFWLDSGFLLKVEDPRTGILETEWNENRADIPKDPIRNILGKVVDNLYSAATRDMYRTRLEPGQTAGSTEVYISHKGVSEELSGTSTIWTPRASDPGLEAEFLRRLMVSLGTEDKKARTRLAQQDSSKPRATLVKDGAGQTHIRIEDAYPRAWRYTGLALDRVGFSVEDRDRSRGVYFVRYNDPLKDTAKKEGWLDKLAFWRGKDSALSEEQYQVALAGDERSTQVLVLDKDGKRSSSETARRILSLLHEQLK